ncbi:MAG: ABC transporter permease [Alphaproteobacteria bacterium]|nr:ABC transporter permease [Alphaproteobacteria bacterium]MCB9698521.1 ABC transporter permease [Alphaproteobacteria bacterium]
MLGAYGVAFLVLLVLLAPMIAPFDPNAVDTGPKAVGPSAMFWMGTDELGRDVWSRILFGGRISLSIGFIAVGLSATIGTAVGAVAAYFGGLVDRVLMFLVDVLLSLPRLVLLLTIVGLFRTQGALGILLIVVVLGVTSWMGIARIVRGEVLSLREREFVQAARALGYDAQRILFRHLIPNAMGPVMVHCSLAIGATMLAEASLSFLGLGVPPPIATWGVMVDDGRSPLRSAPWISIFPGMAIMIAVLSFNLLGDGLRDAMDPKLRGHQ